MNLRPRLCLCLSVGLALSAAVAMLAGHAHADAAGFSAEMKSISRESGHRAAALMMAGSGYRPVEIEVRGIQEGARVEANRAIAEFEHKSIQRVTRTPALVFLAASVGFGIAAAVRRRASKGAPQWLSAPSSPSA